LRNYGGHSMYDPLRRVLVRRPDEHFGAANPARWHYTAQPDLTAASREHDTLVAMLRAAGTEVIYHDTTKTTSADSIYVHDPMLITDAGAILLNMGKALRQTEPAALTSLLDQLKIPLLSRLEGSDLAEGGDLLWVDSRTLAVGQGYRTNPGGLARLSEVLQPLGVTVLPVPLPEHGGPEACLHLMSFISIIDRDLAAVFPPLMPARFQHDLAQRGFKFLDVPDTEFDSMGPNILALAPRQCVTIEGNLITRQRLEAAGCRVQTYRGDEISLKAEGGPTCLTRALLRQTAR
jgi:dimethylargininase